MLSSGDVIEDRWVLERPLGDGGLSEVWLARHRELGSHHALKMLVPRRPRLEERLLLEGRIQARLRHPHIVHVSDVVRHEGRVGLVMEFVEGPTLESFASGRRLSLLETLGLMAPVIAAVHAAHQSGVLHRDLKPANILLATTPRGFLPKVADFGIAKVLEGELEGAGTRAGAVLGTPGYLAPEQALDASTADVRADVFALGAIVWELLAGRRAFELLVPDPDKYVAPRRLADVPEAVADAVARAVAIDPAARFPTVRAFAEALLEGRPELLALLDGGSGDAFASGAWRTIAHSRPTLLPPTSVSPTPIPQGPARWPLVVGLLGASGLAFAAWVSLSEPAAAPLPEAPAVAQGLAEVALPPAPVQPEAGTAEAPQEEAVAQVPAVAAPRAPVTKGAVEAQPVAEVLPGAEVAPAVEVPVAAVVAPPPAPVAVVASGGSAEAPPEPERPEVLGTWRGDAAGRPLRLVIQSSRDGRVEADAVFVLGPTERRVRLVGTLRTDGTLVLRDPDGTMTLQGKVDGGAMSGTYTSEGSGKAQPFRVGWTE